MLLLDSIFQVIPKSLPGTRTLNRDLGRQQIIFGLFSHQNTLYADAQTLKPSHFQSSTPPVNDLIATVIPHF